MIVKRAPGEHVNPVRLESKQFRVCDHFVTHGEDRHECPEKGVFFYIIVEDFPDASIRYSARCARHAHHGGPWVLVELSEWLVWGDIFRVMAT